MANKSIKELPKATQIQEDDALPMQQGTVTKQVTGLTLTLWLLGMADGHGGVKDFQKQSESGLEKTYQFTMADLTTYSFTVTDGNGIADFQTSVSGLVHTYTFIMDDGTRYSFSVSDGEKGDKGDNAYVWYKFASEKPTSSSASMGDEPDVWMGIYSGREAIAPTDPMEYTWVRVRGDRGLTGDPATLEQARVEYQVSNSGTVVPSGNWTEYIPTVPQGSYLWTRTSIQFNTGSIIHSYSNGRNGLDGLGSVVSVNNVSPEENGNVNLTAADVGALSIKGSTMQGQIDMNGQKITGLNDPVEDSDAVRKAYADKMLPKTGGTMSGALSTIAPTQPAHATNKKYVDESNPYNHLHNSNFEKWIAQAGIGGMQATQKYGGCRWALIDGTIEGDQNDDELTFSNIRLTGTIKQVVQNPPDVGTAFVYMVSGSADIEYSDGAVTITSNGGVISGAALFAGTYTKDNKPVYREKGVELELSTCKRYFQKTPPGQIIVAPVFYQGAVGSVQLEVGMRTTPAIFVNVLNTPGGQNIAGTATLGAASTNNFWLNVPGATVGQHYYIQYSAVANLPL